MRHDPFRLRPATARDWPGIADLHATSWSDAYRGIMSDAYLDGPVREDRMRVWRARFTEPVSPDQIAVVAEARDVPGRLVGFCCILGAEDSVWGSLIDNLHVRPGLSRQGLGRRLMAEAAAAMPGRFAETPLYLTVFETNARARGAYERYGGRCVERIEKHEPDGQVLPVLRYAWASPAALVEHLATIG